jgi:hypothetical protein
LPFRPQRLGRRIDEIDFRMRARRIERLDRRARHALRRSLDDEQRHVALAAALARARRDDDEIRDIAVGDRILRSGDAAARRHCLDAPGRRIARAFRESERPDHLARGELRQIFLLLLLAAGEHQGFGGEIDRGRERHGRQRAAEFLRHDAEFEMPGAEPAIGFRNGDAHEAEIGEAFPQGAIVAVLAVENGAHGLRRTLVRQEAPRLIAQRQLFFGEFEIHAALTSSARDRARKSRRCDPSANRL